MAQLSEQDVVNKQFKEPASITDGYDQDDVDFFLDEVAETIAKLTAEKAELQEKLARAEARVTELENAQGVSQPQASSVAPTDAASTTSLAPVSVDNEATEATSVLAMAKQLHDKFVADGKAENERLIAEGEAEKVRIITEAEDIHNRTLTKLEEERSLIERKIAELRDFERDYRTRLKSYLESLLHNVDSTQQ
ncbi:DivIVA domain-containing protein [Arcanobacterium pinnipediorum]|uniref:Cell wall synthesis protein Wag31 n=1 Tax=Arcanobacterium pinnipediorum TaxID=1503041 RepID=A0ABY5AJC8_9ACTO|nr:DivIVA domain-containing protein [Arcanobacterium pinnipediorum]USR80038.1 DivIVA domain-containing protein [Arcanobacterium pinnipediorum]